MSFFSSLEIIIDIIIIIYNFSLHTDFLKLLSIFEWPGLEKVMRDGKIDDHFN